MRLRLLSIFIIFSSIFINTVRSHVRKFNQMDFDKWLDPENYLIVLFCSSTIDPSCINERQKLNTLSEDMIQNKDILFGYIDQETDPILITRYNIKKFPAIKFFPYNNPVESYSLNIPISEFKDKIFEIRDKYLQRVTQKTKTAAKQQRSPITEIDLTDMESTVKDPEKHTILIMYENDCKDECNIMERVAKIFEKDKEIGFYKMNLDKAGSLRTSISFSKNPTIYWYPIGGKNGFIYGGQITLKILAEYINDRAGLSRDYNGELKENAGRIAEIDTIIEENILSIIHKRNINEVIALVQNKAKELPHNKKYIDYYLTVLKEIKKGNDPNQVLLREQDFLNKKLSKDDVSNKNADEWRKFYNIISSFVDLAAKRHQADRAKKMSKKELKAPKSKLAQLREDPNWKMGLKHQSNHDEL